MSAANIHDNDSLFSALPAGDSDRFIGFALFCETHAGRVLARLPWVAAEIAGNDGFHTMLYFLARWGGQRFYVPRRYARFVVKATLPISSRTHRRLLGDQGTARLIDIPSGWGVFLALRQEAIEVAIERGDRRSSIALRFGVTERSLRSKAGKAPSK